MHKSPYIRNTGALGFLVHGPYYEYMIDNLDLNVGEEWALRPYRSPSGYSLVEIGAGELAPIHRRTRSPTRRKGSP